MWLRWIPRLSLVNDYPFCRTADAGMPSIILLSATISTVYVALVLCAFGIFAGLKAPRVVTFIAQNTLIIFLAHMPVYYVVRHWLPDDALSPSARSFVLIAICLPGLALVSSAVRRGAWVPALRRRASIAFTGHEPPAPRTS
jgi:fucose 4-O-acetylase-like acetyltransferase